MNKEKLQQLAHLIAGLLTISYGFDTFEKGDLLQAATFLSIAIIFMIVAGLHKSISKKLLQSDVAFFLLEGLTILYAGYNYKLNGNMWWYYGMAIAGVAYIVFALLSINMDERPNKKQRSRKSRRRSHSKKTIQTEEFLRAGGTNAGNESNTSS